MVLTQQKEWVDRWSHLYKASGLEVLGVTLEMFLRDPWGHLERLQANLPMDEFERKIVQDSIEYTRRAEESVSEESADTGASQAEVIPFPRNR
jgi:hypothetical protein